MVAGREQWEVALCGVWQGTTRQVAQKQQKWISLSSRIQKSEIEAQGRGPFQVSLGGPCLTLLDLSWF